MELRERESINYVEVQSVNKLGSITGHGGKEQSAEYACHRGCWESGVDESGWGTRLWKSL